MGSPEIHTQPHHPSSSGASASEHPGGEVPHHAVGQAISGSMSFEEIIVRLIRYVIEGSAVALAMYLIPQRQMPVREIAMIALTAAAVFAILDMFSPMVGKSTRQGAGFGLGAGLVGFPGLPGVPVA